VGAGSVARSGLPGVIKTSGLGQYFERLNMIDRHIPFIPSRTFLRMRRNRFDANNTPGESVAFVGEQVEGEPTPIDPAVPVAQWASDLPPASGTARTGFGSRLLGEPIKHERF